MAIFIVTLAVMLLLVAGMAVGVLMGREPIKGSCGGMNALGMDTACDICKGDKERCEEENRLVAAAKSSLGYNAADK